MSNKKQKNGRCSLRTESAKNINRFDDQCDVLEGVQFNCVNEKLGSFLKTHLILILGLLIFFFSCTSAQASEAIGTIGLNKFDLAKQYLGTASGGDGSEAYRRVTKAMAQKSLADAQDIGVKLMRVAVTGYAPSRYKTKGDLDFWQSNPDQYWQLMDQMMDDLDASKIHLVPVFMWNAKQFPAMTQDSLGNLIRNPASHSWLLLARYVSEFVDRYRARETIEFYELTNELNLQADIDAEGKCKKQKGSAECRLVSNFSTDEMVAFTQRCASLIRSKDPWREISSGFSIPRAAAEHLRKQPGWFESGPDWTADTQEQLMQNLENTHAAVDIISIHLYDTVDNQRFGSRDVLDLLRIANESSHATGKKIFLGEFGKELSNPQQAEIYINRAIAAAHQYQIPYSAVWVWQYYQTKLCSTYDTQPSAFSLEPGYTNDLIESIRVGNGAQRTGAKDEEPPRLILTSPIEEQLLSDSIELCAVASDNSGEVRRVEFWQDDNLLFVDTTPPYGFLLQATGKMGLHKLKVVASDASGNINQVEKTFSNQP